MIHIGFIRGISIHVNHSEMFFLFISTENVRWLFFLRCKQVMKKTDYTHLLVFFSSHDAKNLLDFLLNQKTRKITDDYLVPRQSVNHRIEYVRIEYQFFMSITQKYIREYILYFVQLHILIYLMWIIYVPYDLNYPNLRNKSLIQIFLKFSDWLKSIINYTIWLFYLTFFEDY